VLLLVVLPSKLGEGNDRLAMAPCERMAGDKLPCMRSLSIPDEIRQRRLTCFSNLFQSTPELILKADARLVCAKDDRAFDDFRLSYAHPTRGNANMTEVSTPCIDIYQ
jgi:hypothetical protein